MIKIARYLLLPSLVLTVLAGCDFIERLLTPATPRATPTAAIMADWFFHGCAYVDANGNGEIDTDDEPLKGAMLLVSLKGMVGFGAPTFSDGCATIVVPGGLKKDNWPVTLSINPPAEDDGLELVEPTEHVLEYPGSSWDFLFVRP
jgi:hypothetical protein